MPNIGGIIKSLQNIMWKDPGVSGDAQRLEQLGWMITLKIIDDKEAEMELINDDYVSVIPSELQWRSWAGNSEGITGDWGGGNSRVKTIPIESRRFLFRNIWNCKMIHGIRKIFPVRHHLFGAKVHDHKSCPCML